MRRHQEESDGDRQQEFLRRRILVAVVELLPQIQVVVRARVEVERHAPDPVEHDVAAEHVRDVRQRPRGFLRHAGDDVVEDFEAYDQDEVDCPGACADERLARSSDASPPARFRSNARSEAWMANGPALTLRIDPIRIQVRIRRLIRDVLQRLRRLRVDQTATPPPPAALARALRRAGGEGAHDPAAARAARERRALAPGEGDLLRAVDDYGRQFGGCLGLLRPAALAVLLAGGVQFGGGLERSRVLGLLENGGDGGDVSCIPPRWSSEGERRAGEKPRGGY